MQRELIICLSRIVTASRNPYEFEPATPYPNEGNNDRITQFGDFIDSPIMASTPANHDKNARLEPAAAFTSERPNSLHIPTPKLRPIPRCDSSPVVSSPLMFTVRQCAPVRHEKIQVASPFNVSYYDDYSNIQDEQPISPTYPTTRGRSSPSRSTRPFERNTSPRRNINQGRPSTSHDDYQDIYHQARPSTSQDTYSQDTHWQALASARKLSHDQSTSASRQNTYRLRSPVRVPSRQSEDNYRNDRHATKSPTKILEDVNEYDEIERRPRRISPPAVRKRARSPMKKMFGENGWLGKSPSEAQQAQFRVRKESMSQKPSMLGRLKSKFEEFVRFSWSSLIR